MLKVLAGAAVAVVALAASPRAEPPPPPVAGPDFSDVHSYMPAWSPDGTRLAVTRYAAPSSGLPPRILVLNADRSHPRPIANGMEPAWSPDGRRVAFVDVDRNLAIVGADGSHSRELLQIEGGYGDGPAWSPDGRRIAFRTGLDVSAVRPDGTGLHRLIRGARQPDWSPDGTRLVFITSGRDDPGSVAIAKADGSGRTVFAPVAEGAGAGEPRWSPDGRRIAFVSSEASGDLAVYVMDVDGTDARRITPLTGFRDPSWTPDSKRLAVAREGEIYIVGLDGAPPVRFTYGGCTIVGTDGADRLTGGSGDDVVCAFGGADVADGGQGDDRILGGGGDDRIDGGRGRDVLLGEDGADAIEGGRGRDSILGGDGPDTIRTHDGEADFADGGGGSDTATSDALDCLILVERGQGGVRGCTGTPTFEVTSDPTWSPDGKRIAFVDRRGLLGTLFAMNADGRAKHRVIPGWFDASWPSWSPNGRQIAFRHGRGTATRPAGVYVVNVDGSGLHRVVDGSQPAWSPRGKAIAFVSHGRAGQRVISVVSPDGTGARVIANSRDECEEYFDPAWSPDGEIVAFTATGAGYECGSSLFIGSTRGSGGVGRVIAGGAYADPDWAPDGRRIALADYSHAGLPGHDDFTVGILDRRTRLVRYLREGSHPRWSPDGRRLVFVRGRTYGPTPSAQIYVMDADGSNLRQLTPTPRRAGTAR